MNLETTRWLILRLNGPMMSFGSVAIDHVGPTARWPGASMLTGLIGNALGWDWDDRALHQALQDRLRFGTMEMRAGDRLTDIQNARLAKTDRGWTTRGAPEGRTGNSYDAPHRRRRDYIVDAEYRIVLALNAPDAIPTLDDVAAALDRPARPLFLGRKPCLPAQPLMAGEVWGATVYEALGALDRDQPRLATWPAEDGPPGIRTMDIADQRIWSSGLHGGTRAIVEGRL
ncbi:type I-E CRISPR-associated protein Cas5/CasD [Jannaschia pagri]|uniref:Type I-E CRISPR-associated protein Cas5/CasD n=1 Tax=Jannaschia pagri TaxID=2829797 RepID=A0ABQ4NRR8_9RHOB|nr:MULTISPECIES: type I-E CRISPR-associated protein Cas5/CasD [unclassified Jannaschia]GIT93243.1 type I-E CRISPR-associated protein Cas5/CasD [Jannaschia sp. AI_61]GIT97090.1 type I-E CRISPR-associated protein Cas5/CasD [Jannaschia sp. AI_62]